MYAGHGDGRRQVYWFLSRNGCQPSSHHCRIPPPSSWLLLLLLLLPERGVARFHIRGRSAALLAEELLVQFAGALGLGEYVATPLFMSSMFVPPVNSTPV